MRKALITGITGQDGSYLTELLLDKGYEIHGVVRPTAIANTARLSHLLADSRLAGVRLFLHHADVTDTASLMRLIARVGPDEVYNLAAQSHVGMSFDIPESTADVTGLGALRLLEAMRANGFRGRFYQASSSEMFGQAREVPQREGTPFHPRSPYAAAKAFAYWATVNYRESYALFACNGILFNHESPRRGELFVTRKITRAVARIKAGREDTLSLGNLDAQRDWGYAKEYVEAMWLMLQQDRADDYVIATGETHSVREFVDLAFSHAGLHWEEHVRVDPRLYRPAEVDLLVGDATKAARRLRWAPSTSFKDLVGLMVEADLAALPS